MSYKPLIYGLAIIFILGGFLTYMLAPFIDVETEAQNTWISPFIDILTGFLRLVGNIISGIVYLIESIIKFFTEGISFSIFGIQIGSGGSEDKTRIEVTGTGFHQGKTLDGDYIYTNYDTFENAYRFTISQSGVIKSVLYMELNETTQNPISIKIGEYGFFGNFKEVYNAVGNLDNNSYTFELTDLSKTYNSIAYGQFYGVEEDKYFYSEAINNLIEESIDKLKISMSVIGLIPTSVGVPLMILILIGILYSIIKLFPFT